MISRFFLNFCLSEKVEKTHFLTLWPFFEHKTHCDTIVMYGKVEAQSIIFRTSVLWSIFRYEKSLKKISEQEKSFSTTACRGAASISWIGPVKEFGSIRLDLVLLSASCWCQALSEFRSTCKPSIHRALGRPTPRRPSGSFRKSVARIYACQVPDCYKVSQNDKKLIILMKNAANQSKLVEFY